VQDKLKEAGGREEVLCIPRWGVVGGGLEASTTGG
jgi:hypothetical protein